MHPSVQRCATQPCASHSSLIASIVWLLILLCPLIAAAQQSTVSLTVAAADLAGEIPLDPDTLTQQELDFVLRHPTLRVAVSATSALPYQTITDGEISGYAIRFLQSVASANGFKLTYQLYPSMTDVFNAIENKEADITPMAGITERRRQFLNFTSGISPNPAGLIGRMSDSKFRQNPQLRGERVAVVEGSAAELHLNSQFPQATPVVANSTEQALTMISDGLSDYYYGSLTEVFFNNASTLNSNLEIKQRVFFSTGWNHIAVRADWPTVTRLFDRYAHNTRNFINPLLTVSRTGQITDAAPPLSLSREEMDYLSGLKKLRVGTINGIPLLNDIDSNGNHVGIASEFMAYVSYQLGILVELKPYETVELMLDALAEGSLDVTPYFAITEDRKASLAFSDPYLTMPWLIVGNTTDTLYWDLPSLQGKTLALRKEHPLAPTIERHYPSITIMLTNAEDESFAAVSSGAADATIETKLYVNRNLTQHYAGLLQVLGEVPDNPGDFAFAVHPRNEMLVPILNKTLDRLDPEFSNRVIRRWVAVDFEPERQLRNVLKVLVPTLAFLSFFLLALIYWNRRVVRESKQRLAAEQRLVDMTDLLQTGVFQFKQYARKPPVIQFSNKVTRHMARVSDNNETANHLKFFDYIDTEDRQRVVKQLRHCLSTGEHFRESFRFNYPTGEKGWVLSDATCREEPDGARVWSGYLFDLTSERLMSEELNAALLDRDEFMSMASHELRTPLQNLSMALQSIDRRGLDTLQIANLKNASNATSDLDELVSDILHLTSMQHHSAVLATEVVNLHELLHSICHGFQNVADAKQLPFKLHIGNDVPQSILGDSLRIKQILYNIISNAIKYTDTGSVTVSVDVVSAANGEPHKDIQFTIADTGLGIAKTHLQRIFEPFATVGPASLRSSGLGLTLSNRLATVMGGSIEVTSVEAQGSTFKVLLPLHESTTHAQDSDSTSEAAVWNEHSDTIMIVDDNLLVRETVAALLVANGWQVVQAENAFEALEKTQDITCKAIITDQKMPGMSGLDLAKQLHERYANNEPRPVLILMSGGVDGADAAMASEVFDAMLFKPIKAGSIRKVVDDIIRGQNPVHAYAHNT